MVSNISVLFWAVYWRYLGGAHFGHYFGNNWVARIWGNIAQETGKVFCFHGNARQVGKVGVFPGFLCQRKGLLDNEKGEGDSGQKQLCKC